MSVVIPPAPSHEDASAVMARLARLSRDMSCEEKDDDAVRQPRVLLIVSCILSTCGIFLLICAIAVICAPDAALSQVVFLVCEMLF